VKIGILVAMEEELKRLKEEIPEATVKTIANQTFYDGIIYKQPVTIVQAGIGKVNAAVATTLLIQNFQVDVVINTGSAGGIATNLAVGDLVISTHLAHHDADNRVFGYKYGQIPQMPATYTADKKWAAFIEKAAYSMNWEVEKGMIVSGDSFVASAVETNRIKEHFPKALMTEMEGAAVAQTCTQFEIPFAIIRAVSDTADEEADISFDEFVLLAGKRSAELVLKLIENLNEEEM